MSVAEFAEEWELTLGEPYVVGAASESVVRAELVDGTPAVLKIGIPHRVRALPGEALRLAPPRGVAQPGSALRSGRRGPQFKSGHPD